ncbi:MAG: hypothetical protein H6587_10985 [Flavobacteriales bacterium]|nr:hypothetical protein [Flavobacteriales bacterium]
MICWICNKNKADSGEHKFKSSLLKKMYGKQFKEEILFGTRESHLRIQGVNNKKVKFPKVICKNCNNTITSQHDKSFDVFINYVNDNYNTIFQNQSINFENIYSENWFEEKKNLYKYIAKHAGCKIVTGNFEYNVNNLSEFIFDDINTSSFQIEFQLKEGFKFLDICLKQQNTEGLRFMSNGQTVYYKNKEGKIVFFAGITSYNWLSITWVYTQNGYKTNFVKFSDNPKQKVAILPFHELPEIGKKDWFDILDNQRMESLDDQINYYHTFLKLTNEPKDL